MCPDVEQFFNLGCLTAWRRSPSEFPTMQLASPVLAEVANELRQACVVGSLGGWQHHYPPYYGKKAGDPPIRATTALFLAFALTSGKGVRMPTDQPGRT